MPTDYTQTPSSIETSAYRGRVTKVGATVDDPIEIVIPNFSASAKYEVPAAQWSGSVVPAVGAVCLVILDDEGDAWVPVV
jgi:hypothetical protein